MDILEQEIWKTNYVQPMFEKYKEIPTALKYAFIEKDYSRMFGGKREAQQRMRHLYDDSETFIFAFENALCEFSLRIRINLIKKYWEELAFDLFINIYEAHKIGEQCEKLTGVWLADKKYFCNLIAEQEDKKEYVRLIMT